MDNEVLSSLPAAGATVMIISDEVESARIWAFSLKQAGYEVCLAGFSEKTLHIWSEEFPDVVVLEDLNSKMDVFEFCHALRQEAAVPILLLTSHSNEAYILQAYQAGADDCIAPPVSPRLFLAKIHAWLRRSRVVPSAALDQVQAGAFHLDPDRRQLLIPGGLEVKLTNLEARLLYLLMAHPGWVLETGYLVDRVWGHFGEGDGVLLKNVIYRLRKKIEPDPGQPRYILTESTIGYKFQPGGEGGAPGKPASEERVPGSPENRASGGNRQMFSVRRQAPDEGRFRAGRLAVDLPQLSVRHTSQLRPNFLPNQK